jgi:hypothetical protein
MSVCKPCPHFPGYYYGFQYSNVTCPLCRADSRVAHLEALLHRAHNQFENITVAHTLEAAHDRAHRGVAFTDDAGAEHG